MKKIKALLLMVSCALVVNVGVVITHAQQIPAPTVTFTVNRASDNPSATGISISTSDFAYLNWATVNADGCNASGDPSGAWSGPKSVTQTKQATTIVGPLSLGTHIYTITCNGGGGMTTSSVAVNVLPFSALIPAVTLSASPTSVSDGGSTTLTWSATNANSCSPSKWLINGSTSNGPSGSQTAGPLSNSGSPYTFGLTCYGYYGNSSNSVTVTVASISTPAKKLGGAGEFCGGIAAFQCIAGYSCKLDGSYPDAGGTCVVTTPTQGTTTTAPSGTGAGSTQTIRQQIIQLIITLVQLVQQAVTQGTISHSQALTILGSIQIPQ